METIINWYQSLSILDKIGFWSSILTFITVFISIIKAILKFKIKFSKKIIREFLFVYKSPLHYVYTFIIFFAILFYLIQSGDNFLYKFIVLLGYITCFCIFLSFFIKQNKPIMRQLILSHIESIVKKNNDNCVSAIKFDVDLIVAINDYSYAVGNAIVSLLKDTLSKKALELKSIGKKIVSIEIPESDEVIWILPNINTTRAADIADEIRREVKSKIKDIEYYNEACEFVIKKLVKPPLNDEEKQGIGTISAGVAAYTRGVETLLSDISYAMKEAKFKGRNRTIIYQPGNPAIVRDH